MVKFYFIKDPFACDHCAYRGKKTLNEGQLIALKIKYIIIKLITLYGLYFIEQEDSCFFNLLINRNNLLYF